MDEGKALRSRKVMNKTSVSLLFLGAVGIAVARAQFAPLSLTPESYNYDVIVEKTATPPPAAATTATMDQGTNNAAATYYEQGFNVDAADTGLPAAGSTFASASLSDHSYTLAPSYTAPNALLVNAQVTNAVYTVTTPTAVSSLSFLGAAGGGGPTLTYIVTHADGSTETGTFVVPDWFNGADPALTLNGRVDAVSRTFDNVNNNNPRLYSID